MQELKYVSSIEINGLRCFCYQGLMQHLKLSLHINGLRRRQEKYRSQFLEINGRYYVTEDYAQLLADFRAVYATCNTIKTNS